MLLNADDLVVSFSACSHPHVTGPGFLLVLGDFKKSLSARLLCDLADFSEHGQKPGALTMSVCLLGAWLAPSWTLVA